MKRFAKLFFAVYIVMMNTVPILAHGVRINHTIDATTGAITITAAFDTGEVLDEAAVIIFAPNDLINPWSTGVMDETGSYTFTPDYTIEGYWDIQIRKAGHGGLINIAITADMMPEEVPQDDETASETQSTVTLSDGSQIVISGDAQFQVNGDIVISATGSMHDANTTEPQVSASDALGNGFTLAQIVIMSISIIWGCIGTALYFARRKSPQ